ncbi:helix-turn-helix transcriptional regulator [Pseudoxanthomonas kaohsiungensis]|uniref:Helix-turn-helix transcriptional regulator n=2 Tax=Pseudoxanthomonas kaohsiungensis TaxID=283923 RepID=A0ABW3LUS1_9GAMM|nr:AlpA family phage regulatory protein [Pseudoxanthomonas kaohsiungensis]KAF1704232.1 AlpA family transcriptional regulator [Pseudoxanthomonas kaohsiungensis]
MTDSVRILRIHQVRERTGLSRSTIYELVAEGVLPPPVRIGRRTAGWVEAEISDFIRRRIAESRAVPGGAACVR